MAKCDHIKLQTTSLTVAKLWGSFWLLEKVMHAVSVFLFTSGIVYPPIVIWSKYPFFLKKKDCFIIHSAIKVMWTILGFS